ncbi:HNH endonuclease [Candidatus Neomarinimicrobiota bacterium]
MAYWIFKMADQDLYPDILGQKYVFDNTHSIRVRKGDVFVYLDKRNKDYAFTASGIVSRLTEREPTPKEKSRSYRIRRVYTAHLESIIWFHKPLSILSTTKKGRMNRAKLGIVDVNLLGWSQSIPRLTEEIYSDILGLAESNKILPSFKSDMDEYSIHDAWGKTRIRKSMVRFNEVVFTRHRSTCAVCGTKLGAVLEVAHLSPYATDSSNRANPANGICLCVFCHRALDRRLIAIQPNADLLVADSITDPVAAEHFRRITKDQRVSQLRGIDPRFLELTVYFFKEANFPD